MKSMQNKAKIAISIQKRSIAILALLSLVVSIATPQRADAKMTDDIKAFFSQFAAAPALADEVQNFPEANDREPVKTIWVTVTAYNSLPGQTDNTPCITANGHDLCKQYAEQGFGNTIAANGIKFGTQVRLPEIFGDKEFVVRDRMNARYEYGRIDVWVPTLEEAKAFGVKRVQMEIYN